MSPSEIASRSLASGGQTVSIEMDGDGLAGLLGQLGETFLGQGEHAAGTEGAS